MGQGLKGIMGRVSIHPSEKKYLCISARSNFYIMKVKEFRIRKCVYI